MQQNLTAATFARVSELGDQDRSNKYQEKVNSTEFPTRTVKLMGSELKGRTCSRKPLTIKSKEAAQVLLWEKLQRTGLRTGRTEEKRRIQKS